MQANITTGASAPALHHLHTYLISTRINGITRNFCKLARSSTEALLLEWFSGATEAGTTSIGRLERVAESIGRLVTSDKGASVTGSFQDPTDVSGLLFSIAESIRAACALVEIGDAASYRLCHHVHLAWSDLKSEQASYRTPSQHTDTD